MNLPLRFTQFFNFLAASALSLQMSAQLGSCDKAVANSSIAIGISICCGQICLHFPHFTQAEG